MNDDKAPRDPNEKYGWQFVPKKDFDAVVKERDELKAKYDEILSYLPKVPTEPYEKELARKYDELRAQADKLAEALEFYGKVYNYDNCFRNDLGCYVLANSEDSSDIEQDRGRKARDVLKQYREKCAKG